MLCSYVYKFAGSNILDAAKLFPYTSSNEAYLTFWQAARTHRHICEPDMACSFQIGFFVIFATIKTALESLLPLSVQTQSFIQTNTSSSGSILGSVPLPLEAHFFKAKVFYRL